MLKKSIDVTLLAGDNKETTKKVADEVQIEYYIASMLPEDKNLLRFRKSKKRKSCWNDWRWY